MFFKVKTFCHFSCSKSLAEYPITTLMFSLYNNKNHNKKCEFFFCYCIIFIEKFTFKLSLYGCELINMINKD